MRTKLKEIKSKVLGASFYVYKATKHHSVSNNTQSSTSCVQPGDYVVLDKHFNVLVFSRNQFKAAFGHKALEQMDECLKE